MRHKDRVLAAFRGEFPDRVATFEQVISSTVASAILGRPAFTGSTSLHFHESMAWMRGEQAHAEFVEQVYEDNVAIHKKLDLDAIYLPWRFSVRPTRQVDEFTFLYGDENSDNWYKMSLDPDSQTYGENARARPFTLDDVVLSMKKSIETVARGNVSVTMSADQAAMRLVKEYGEEYAIALGGAAISIPIQEAWLQAAALERELVEDYLDARVQWVILRLRHLKKIGIDYVNGGADFADKNGPIYSPRFFRETMAPRWKKIIDECRRLDLPYVMRSDGNLWPVAEEMFGQVRPHGYGEVDWEAGMDPKKLREAFPELVIFGNVPCGSILINGTPEEVAECTRYVIRSAAPRLVLGSSNAILHGTRPENVFAMFETARAFSAEHYKS